ncbi:hypothetical protein BDR05DRAFT_964173 [Suillus weaverae]|nr:hypothetical protein BDR05DRAFT_964173 [Suillus weaverae]
MILKEGQIVEQGSHRELLELSGLFVSIHADQISASEDPKAPAGYDVDDDAPVVDIPDSEMRSTAVEERIAVDSPKSSQPNDARLYHSPSPTTHPKRSWPQHPLLTRLPPTAIQSIQPYLRMCKARVLRLTRK